MIHRVECSGAVKGCCLSKRKTIRLTVRLEVDEDISIDDAKSSIYSAIAEYQRRSIGWIKQCDYSVTVFRTPLVTHRQMT